MFAIIEDSGTQIKVSPGDVLDVDLREVGPRTKKLRFDRVLLVSNSGDGDAAVGTPYVSGAAVTAEILGEVKADKIDVIKYKRRKGYKRKYGHRQRFLRVKIGEIEGVPGKKRTTKKKTNATKRD